MLLIFSLVGLLYAEAAGIGIGTVGWLARSGVPVAAILMPAGFFFSGMGEKVTAPNRWIVLVYFGAVSLAAGLIALGIGVLTAP